MPQINELWECQDKELWEQALTNYWQRVKLENLPLERRLDSLRVDDIRAFDAQGWFRFLHDEYFRWKYTAANRYVTTTNSLQRQVAKEGVGKLLEIRDEILEAGHLGVLEGLQAAMRIKGLGTAGGSGLMALLFPRSFATVDQFVVKALTKVETLPIVEVVRAMNPKNLRLSDGIILIRIMSDKARALNDDFQTDFWTPRKIDMILWAGDRPKPPQSRITSVQRDKRIPFRS